MHRLVLNLIIFSFLIFWQMTDSRLALADFESVKSDILAGKYETGITALKKLATAKDQEAQLYLGELYLDGNGVPRSTSNGFMWINASAELKHTPAEYKMGLLYFKGIGRPLDLTKSIEWMTRAADKKHVEATLFLGLLHSRIHGGQLANRRKAIDWFTKAIDLGSMEAVLALEELHIAEGMAELESKQSMFDEPKTDEERLQNYTLQWIKDINKAMQRATISPRGRINVSKLENGSYYIAIKGFRVAFDNGNKGLIGKLRLTVTPEGNINEETNDYDAYSFVGEFPKVFLYRPKDKQSDVYAQLEPQTLTGRWSSVARTFEDFDLKINNLSIGDTREEVSFLIDTIAVGSDLKSDVNGFWSGNPFNMEIAGVSASTINSGLLFKLGLISIDTYLNKFNMSTYDRLIKMKETNPLYVLQTIMGTIRSQQVGDPNLMLLESEGLNVHIEGLQIYELEAQTGSEVIPEISIGNLDFGIDITGLDSQFANFIINISGKNVESVLSGDYEPLRPVTPTSMNAKLSINKIPVWDIAETFTRTFLEGISSSQLIEGKLVLNGKLEKQLQQEITDIVQSTGTLIKLSINSDSEQSDMIADGMIVADANAKFGASGGIDISIDGMDNLNAIAEQSGSKIPFLGMLPFFANTAFKEKSSEGAELNVWKFELNRQGQMMMNGQVTDPSLIAPKSTEPEQVSETPAE